jgi:HSP20 family protein
MPNAATTPSTPQTNAEAVAPRRNVPAMLDEIREDLEHFWHRSWPMLPLGRPLRRFSKALAEWAPKTDVFEHNGHLVVKADLPGLKREDIEVKMENGDLVLTGERKEETEVNEKDFYRCERTVGSFYRRLPLDFEVDPKKVEAKFADGVLEVKLPMLKEVAPEAQRITVS